MRWPLVVVALWCGPSFAQTRAAIRLPEGCSFTAGAPAAASTCADMLVLLKKTFERSTFKESCGDWPDLEAASRGEKVPGLAFLPLGRGHFLLQVRCTTGAYNESSLFFLWDDRTHEFAPPLVLFPAEGAVPEALVFARDFDAKRLTLWELRKELGDGSAGRYRRFTFVNEQPVLDEQVSKDGADHLDPYDFSRKAAPRGAKWVRTTPKSTGCLATLVAPACPGPPPSKTDAAVGEVLGAQQQPIIDCVLNIAGADTDAPGWKQAIKVKVVIKKGGELFTVDTTLDPDGPKRDATQACIEKVVRGITWPVTDAAMLSFEKDWTLSF